MRLLILGVSALSLSACSVGGLGFGSGHADHNTNAHAEHGSWQNTHQGQYAQGQYSQGQYARASAPAYGASQYGSSTGYGYASAQTYGQAASASASYGHGYAPTPYPPAASPCYQQYRSPCAAAQQQPVQYPPQYMAPPQVNYPTGYPTGPMPSYTPPPAPQHPVQPPAHNCGVSTCSSHYSVSPYGYAGDDYSYLQTNYAPETPNHHAYGSQAGSYGHASGHTPSHGLRNANRRNDSRYYGTLGAVWYDVDNPYGGVQGRLGYQATSLFGAEAEASIGVIKEVSPFNQDLGGGNILSGEYKDGVDYSIAAFGTARVPLSRNISTHARLGYHSTRSSAEVNFDNNPDQKVTSTTDGIAYGAGIVMDITPVDAIRADFTRYEGDAQSNDAVSLAYLRRF